MNDDLQRGTRERWARLRFSILGPLLASPPEPGELQQKLAALAAQSYRHPTTGEKTRFACSTIERWWYLAQHHPDDPFGALARKVHRQAGTHPSLSQQLEQVLRAQYRRHPSWSYRLHYDNVVTVAEQHQLGQVPSYITVTRFMKSAGLVKRRRRGRTKTDSAAEARGTFESREHRSFEVPYVHGLWHADFHVGSRKVLLPSGQWEQARLFGVLDDRSRLCCHLQWYLAESAQTFVHGLSQALLKRGLPRALLTDNGAAMTAAETEQGLERLGVVHHTTLSNCPEQNAKIENFWGRVEGRLMAMLEGQTELTLELLNQATQAWVELEYHHQHHDELGSTPLAALLQTRSVGREAPDSETLRRRFRQEQSRRPRRSDATISVQGVRFELPWHYRTLEKVTIRFARWDLSSVDLVDPKTDTWLGALYPVDKNKNADRQRRLAQPAEDPPGEVEPDGIAPRLRKLIEQYAATGLPPAYLPLRHEAPVTQTEPDSETPVASLAKDDDEQQPKEDHEP